MGIASQDVGSQEIPGLANLDDANFERREHATRALKKWAANHPVVASRQLSELLFTSADPEVRYRLVWVLREIRMQRPKSYLGFSYSVEQSPQTDRTILVIKAITRDGPAEGGGLLEGDHILSVEGKPFPLNVLTSEIKDALSSLAAEKKLAIAVLRGKEHLSISIRPRTKKRAGERGDSPQKEFHQWLTRRREEFSKLTNRHN